MSTNDGKEYALGANEAEIVRLGVQHKIWSAAAFAIWERAGISAGKRVLDLGCGPGYTSFDLAGVVTSQGHVVAIDEAPFFIEHLKNRLAAIPGTNVDARLGDVQRLDVPAESFDAVYQRWVLCFVKDPEAVIRGAARALKPGGVFAIQEYMHYEAILLAPESEAFLRFVAVVSEAWKLHGGDTKIGMKLPSLLIKHGLVPREIRPLHRIARPHSQLWTWPSIFIDTYAPKLVQDGLLTRQELDALVRDWAARSKDPGAFFCSPPMIEIIAVKE